MNKWGRGVLKNFLKFVIRPLGYIGALKNRSYVYLDELLSH